MFMNIQTNISSPLDQFEIRYFLSFDIALSNIHLSLTNIGLYLTIASFIISFFSSLGLTLSLVYTMDSKVTTMLKILLVISVFIMLFSLLGLYLSSGYTPLDIPMSGVRCPTCATNGQESWVIPGKTCGYCGTGC